MSIKKKTGARGWLARLAFPPVLAIAVYAAITFFTRTRPSFTGLQTPVAVGLGVLYVGLCAAYLSFGRQGASAPARASALVADGLMFLFVTGDLGASIAFAWGGVAMIGAGLVFALTHMAPKPKQRFAQISQDLFPASVSKADIKTVIDTIIFPAAFLQSDDSGVERVVAANDPLAAILGRVADKMAGVPFADVMPPEIEAHPVHFADADWGSHRTAKGRQTMFMLSPLLRPSEEKEPERRAPSGANFDAETGLWSTDYMRLKCASDIALAKRYKRQLSVIVFQLDFSEKNLVSPSDDMKKASRAAFGRMLMAELRVSDTAVRTGEDEVTVFLPETSQKGAKTVATRVFDTVRKIAQLEVPEIAQVNVIESILTLFGDEITDLDQVLRDVERIKTKRR